MKGMENLSAGMPDFMKKWYFWVGISVLAIVCIAGCTAGGIYNTNVAVTPANEEVEAVDQDEAKKLEERLAAEKKAEEERLAKEKKEEEELRAAEETKKKVEEEKQRAEAEAKRIEEEKKAISASQSTPPTRTTPSQTAPSNSHYVHGYCKDGTTAYGDPSARGKANVCYGHKGWRDEY